VLIEGLQKPTGFKAKKLNWRKKMNTVALYKSGQVVANQSIYFHNEMSRLILTNTTTFFGT